MRYLLLTALILAVIGCDGPAGHRLTLLDVPAGSEAAGPRMTSSREGKIALSWMEPDNDGTTLWYATLGVDGWSSPRAVVGGKDMFVNWADLPSVMHVSGEHWAAHWLEMAGDTTYAYHVVMVQSFDDGISWTEPVKPHADGTPTEHGFVSVFPSDGGLSAIWLDGRRMVNEATGDPMDTGMTLRTATLDRQGLLHGEQEIDDLVCDCCQTDVAVTDSGPVVLYRNRTTEEIRDIHVGRLTGTAWQTGESLHDDDWNIAGCPVNGPAVAASGSRVAAAWFTAAAGHARVQLKFSDDSGRTFGGAIPVASAGVLGHVDTVLLHDGSAVVSWLETGAELARLRVGRFGPDRSSEALTVADGVDPRSVPQMALDGDLIVLVWTARQGDKKQIRSGALRPTALALN